MVSKKGPVAPPKGPTMPASKVVPRLREQHEKATALLASGALSDADMDTWRTQTRHWLTAAFGEDDRKVSEVLEAGRMRVLDTRMSASARRAYFESLLKARADQLMAVIEILEIQAADEEEKNQAPTAAPSARVSSKKVFIVHGHDETAKQTVARFISKLQLEEVILHEQPNRGRTIIEKFEAYAADVAYAVVLLTPDDRGGTLAAKLEEQQPRARQNVVFELGFFVGALGRDRVCALHKSGTELPSDISGVVYISMDPNDGWKLPLAKEIKQVIPTVDLNNAL